jgi:hypothetical protein
VCVCMCVCLCECVYVCVCVVCPYIYSCKHTHTAGPVNEFAALCRTARPRTREVSVVKQELKTASTRTNVLEIIIYIGHYYSPTRPRTREISVTQELEDSNDKREARATPHARGTNVLQNIT